MNKILKKFKEEFLTLKKMENCVSITYKQAYKTIPYTITIKKLENRRTGENN